jgi:hypothetical protein
MQGAAHFARLVKTVHCREVLAERSCGFDQMRRHGCAHAGKRPDIPIERLARKCAGVTLRKNRVIERMIDRIKQLFGDPDSAAPG